MFWTRCGISDHGVSLSMVTIKQQRPIMNIYYLIQNLPFILENILVLNKIYVSVLQLFLTVSICFFWKLTVSKLSRSIDDSIQTINLKELSIESVTLYRELKSLLNSILVPRPKMANGEYFTHHHNRFVFFLDRDQMVTKIVCL